MPKRIPSYPASAHKSGQARIRLNGRDVYLGVWNSPESRVAYARAVAEYAAAGSAPSSQTNVTVAELLSEFWTWANARYVKNGRPTSEVAFYEMALAPMYALYLDLDVSAFGPLCLIACRDELRKLYCRTKVNQHLGRIRRVFKWGVSRELVRPDVWTALRSVEGLRKGEAYDPPKVTTVPKEHIEAIKPHVLPPVWAMIEIQLWTAMRPGEVTAMRTCDVFAEHPSIPKQFHGKLWAYVPESHKTEHHDKGRVILLGPHAQEVIRPWLQPDRPEAYLFSPAEAMEYHRADRAAKRVTPGQSNYQRKRRPKKRLSQRYNVSAYTHAIHKACKKEAVNLPVWGPNRLRHNAATLIRKQYGVEVARIICGHSSAFTTEIYAEADLEKAAKAMIEMG
jgi:integrase